MRTLTILITLALPATAQVFTPLPQTSANNTAANGDDNTTIIHQKPTSQSIYGNEVPFIDPTHETITLMGHTFDLGDNRLGGQFQAYLAGAPNTSKAALEYRETIDSILKAVSPHNHGIPISQKLRDGFALLPRAASYPGDGRICDSLSNAIYAAMLSKGTVTASKEYIANLEKEKKRVIRNADVSSSKANLSSNTKLRIGQGKDNRRSSSPAQSYEIQEMTRRIAEIEALKKLHRAKDEVNIIQAKIHYQALLAQLFIQRRFEHVVIGTRFYNLIFRDGDSKLRLKKDSDLARFFGESLGVEPTITGLDSAANEAMRKVTNLVSAFHNHLRHKELHSGAKRLTEAYAIGEFLPVVQTIPSADRRQILEYSRDGNALVKAMDVRDYAQAKILLESLKKKASDFDSIKAQGAIAAFTRMSDGHLRSARMALVKGDQSKFEEELKNATQVWPTNPSLKEIDQRLDRLVADGGMANKILNDFDRLLSEDNFREIYRRRFEFVPVVKDDPERKDAIEQIVQNIALIDTTVRMAEASSRNGNDFAAWEALAELRDQFPKDPELLQKLEKLSLKVADFTVALARAREFEENDLNPQTGSALTWYMQAKSIYPDSNHAQAGIDRLANRIMPKDPGTSASGPTTSGELDDDVSLD